jgi:hypothetical protein
VCSMFVPIPFHSSTFLSLRPAWLILPDRSIGRFYPETGFLL